jgi:hypothetical protein
MFIAKESPLYELRRVKCDSDKILEISNRDHATPTEFSGFSRGVSINMALLTEFEERQKFGGGKRD